MLDTTITTCLRRTGALLASSRSAVLGMVVCAGLLAPLFVQAQAGIGRPGMPSAPLPSAPQSPLYNSPANARARQIVQQAIAAMGGPAFLGTKYRSGHGRVYSFDSMGGLASPGVQFWSFHRFPDAERVELTKKRNVVYIYNGNKGWEITFRGVQPLPTKALRQFQESRDHSMEMVLRRWAQNPQTLMIYRGVNMVDQGQVDTIDFSNSNGDTVTIDFDLNNHLPVRVHWRQNDPLTGGYYEKSITYGNYQKIDGITTPLIIQNFEGTQRVQQLFYDQMSFAPLSDSLFEPTAKKK